MGGDAERKTFVAALLRMTTIVILTVLLFGILWTGYLYVAQDSLIYYPRGYSAEEIEFAREHVDFLTYEISAGKQVAYWVPPSAGGGGELPERIWLLFGGNAARALDWADLIERLDLEDAGFLLVDYPGYGLCEGTPSPRVIEESTARAVAECARHLGAGEPELTARLAVLGHSLGAAAALLAAERYNVDRVVLLSPFTSMKDMAALTVGGPLSNMVRHRYDNRARVRALLEDDGVVITVIHGADDAIIPARMGRELSEMDPARIAFHAVPAADHNDLIAYAFPILREAMR